MIIYFAGRIVSWMYGYAWPLMNSDARAILATMSIIEMAAELPMGLGWLAAFVYERLDKSRRD